MKFRTKAIGLFAGSALALSLAGGAIAADETIVTLNDGQPCAVSATAGVFDFGTWVWDGTEYVEDEAPEGSLTITVTNSIYDVEACDVTVSPEDLEPGSVTTTGDIPGTDVNLTVTSGSNSGSSPYVVTTLGQANLVLGATLTTNLDDYEPAIYQGDIIVSADASAG